MTKRKSVDRTELIEGLRHHCESLLRRANALAVWLLDDFMQEITHVGRELPDGLELPTFAREVEDELVLRVGKCQVIELRVTVGLLVVVFDETSSLGVVRRHARSAQKILGLLYPARKPGPMPPPVGSSGSGSGGAPAEAFVWPPAGRNRGSA